MDSESAIVQIDAALKLAEDALNSSESAFRIPGQYAEAVTISASTIDRLTSRDSVYQANMRRALGTAGMGSPFYVDQLVGVLKGLRRDIESGYLLTLEQEAHGAVFSDLLEMADHLVVEKLVLPAAVVAGSALEAHLRSLAERSGVKTMAREKPKRAGRLNDELGSKGIYRKAEQKQILAWQDIRNSAAHGEGDFSAQEVRLMVQGIRDFVGRHPA